MSAKPSIILADETVSITRPISDLFAFLSNHENYSCWFPGAMSVTSTDDLPPGAVGKVYVETLLLPSGRRKVFDIKVVERQAPDLFITEGNLALIHPRMEMRLIAISPAETRLSLRFLSRSQSFVGRLLIRGLVRRLIGRQTRAGLAKLKALME